MPLRLTYKTWPAGAWPTYDFFFKEKQSEKDGLDVTLPAGILSEYTRYYWRARVKDGSGDAATEWSAWSPPASFRTAYAFPFLDDFSLDRGWRGLTNGGWQIGPALGGGGEYGHPDPDDDVTPDSLDRMILGYALGGDYLPDADEAAVSPPVDCSEADVVELSFWRWLGVEGNDWGRASVSVSTDGHDWHDVWANPATDVTDEEWQQIVYDLTPWAAGRPTVFFQFRMGPMVASYPFCGWNVDDVQLGPAAARLAQIILQVNKQALEVGDVYNLEIYVQEDHPEAAGLLGASVRLDFTQGLSSYQGSSTVANCVVNPPWNLLRRGVRSGNVLTELSGLTQVSGHGDGAPVLLARVPMKAVAAGIARFECTPAAAFALPSPFGQVGPWRVAGAVLEVDIAADALEPLARLTLQGPTAPVALGNTFTIQVLAEEMSAEARGFLGGPFDLYFDLARVSAPGFSAAAAIQPPYTDIGLVSGTLQENRIDELGGATVKTGYGNGSKVVYAMVSFQADALGEAVFAASAGASGLTLTSPVGQLPFERIDYGLPFAVDIRPNFAVTITGGSAASTNCYAGQVISLQADTPAPGWAFSQWEGDEASLGALASPTQAATTLTVPGTAVSLNAVYRMIDYTLTVTGGSGSAAPVHIGDQLEIVAEPPAIGKVFDRWTGDVQVLDDPNAATTTVTVATANIAVTATYRNLLYRVEVVSGTGDTETAVYGQKLTIAADPAPTGYVFGGWGGSEEDLDCLASRYASTTVLTQPDRDVHLTASYSAIDYQLTVVNGSGTAVANYQDVIAIAADPPSTGQAFSHWSGDVGCLDNPQAAAATVTMPAAHVTLTAVYVKIPYTLLVVNGAGSGTYYYGDVVSVKAGAAPAGSLGFAAWVGHVQCLQDASAPETTLSMPAAHTAVVAVFGTYDSDTVELTLKAGWNCIAVPFETANPVGTVDSKGHDIRAIWRWDGLFVPPVNAQGVADTTIKPNVGYWIFCLEDCVLTFHRWQQN